MRPHYFRPLFISLLFTSVTLFSSVSSTFATSRMHDNINKVNNLTHTTGAATTQRQNTLPSPIWWNGQVCDASHYQANNPAGQTSFILDNGKATWRGLEACGPEPQGNSNLDAPVQFTPGGSTENEWECTELVKRYLFLAFNLLSLGGTNGNQVVSNYAITYPNIVMAHNNGDQVFPNVGDVLSYTNSNPAGHTAIVTKLTIKSGSGNAIIQTLEQNGDPAKKGINTNTITNWTIVDNSDGHVTGWLHAFASLNPLSIQSGPPTSTITVSGAGMQANESVAINFDSQQFATTTASSTGTFSAKITLPASTQLGSHLIYASGVTSGRQTDRAVFLVQTDWSMFGFNVAHTHYNPYENVLNPSNVSQLIQNWTAPLTPGGFSYNSSPAIVNGVLYIGASAFNAVTGAFLWSSTGKAADTVSSPAVVNGVMYIGAENGVQAYNAAGCGNTICSPLWTGITGDTIDSSPVIANGLVYVIDFDGGTVFAFNASGCGSGISTCQFVWSANTNSQNFQSSPAVAGGVVYVGSAYPDGKLYAFDAKSGMLLWTASTIATGITGISSPLVYAGKVYVAAGAFGSTILYSFNASGCGSSTCQPVWTTTVPQSVIGSPSVASGVIYIFAGDAKNQEYLYTFSANTGTSKWSTPIGYSPYSIPTIANGVVYIASGNAHVYAFNASGCGRLSCSPLWTTTLGGEIDSSPVVSNGMLYINSSSEGILYSFHLPICANRNTTAC